MSGYQTCFGNGSWNLLALNFPEPSPVSILKELFYKAGSDFLLDYLQRLVGRNSW